MKRSKSEVNINQLLHDLPESTQQVIRGGDSPEGARRGCRHDVVFVIIGA